MRTKRKPSECSSTSSNGVENPSTVKIIAAGITLCIALWGAGLSTWIYWEQRQNSKPRIYVRMDVEAAGFDTNNIPAGDVQVLFANVGEKTFSIAPIITILAVDSRSGKTVMTEASFVRTQHEAARPYKSSLPVTLKPGDDALAKSATMSLQQFVNPLDYHSVLFELSNKERYSVLFANCDYIKRDKNNNKFVGLSAGGLATRIK